MAKASTTPADSSCEGEVVGNERETFCPPELETILRSDANRSKVAHSAGHNAAAGLLSYSPSPSPRAPRRRVRRERSEPEYKEGRADGSSKEATMSCKWQQQDGGMFTMSGGTMELNNRAYSTPDSVVTYNL